MLDKNRLKTAIKSVFDAEADKDIKPDEARERMADGIAQAVIDEIKKATISVNGVATTGTAAAQLQSVAVIATIS